MKLASNRGQATLEYILMLAIIVGLFAGMARFFTDSDINGRIMGPLTDQFRRTYQFGNPKTKGLDQEEPINHARVEDGQNFRLFFVPK